MTALLAVLAVNITGAVTAIVATAHGGDIGPWVSGGGSAVSVGGMVWVARQVVAGKLVVRDVARSEALLEEAVSVLKDCREVIYRPVTTRSRRSDG